MDMLRVGFEFTKSLDENTNWSTGSVKIYGLTLETFNKLDDYLETEVEVQVGYEYSTIRKLDKVFRTVLIDKSYVVESGISVSTFNLQGYYSAANSATSGGKIAVNFPENAIAFNQNFPQGYITYFWLTSMNLIKKQLTGLYHVCMGVRVLTVNSLKGGVY